MCDEREEYGTLKQRCYIRWVDVYAERPNFGALFTFITPLFVGRAEAMCPDKKRAMIRRGHTELSFSQQCKLVRLSRSAFL